MKQRIEELINNPAVVGVFIALNGIVVVAAALYPDVTGQRFNPDAINTSKEIIKIGICSFGLSEAVLLRSVFKMTNEKQ